MALFRTDGELAKSFGNRGYRFQAAPHMGTIEDTVFDRNGNLYALGNDDTSDMARPNIAVAKFTPASR